MYWGKDAIAMTPSPRVAWATVCYLNDRLSLDGRNPSTYGNTAAMFSGFLSDRKPLVYGRAAMTLPVAEAAEMDGSRPMRPDQYQLCLFRRKSQLMQI